jgi:hypothetical protein
VVGFPNMTIDKPAPPLTEEAALERPWRGLCG